MTRTFDTSLPIDAALPGLTAALRDNNCAVLVAPPGAGKTTRVPLALVDEAWAADKKILVLEPRRLAARAAASRMAATLKENVGDTVGLRVRFGSKVSKATRIEVITEGIFTRMILDDPELSGVAAVLFDEFHERSLDADLGLALARDAQQGLREDLRLLVMSATLDGARVSKLLGDAPVIESEGRAFPVETRYLGRDPRARIESEMAAAVTRALRADPGSVLVFLPGAVEIRRTETFLKERIDDPAVDVVALYGALEGREQDRAISPAPAGRRKVVLATSIAETSLTIEGVRIVIDSGLARVPRYEPDVALTRLETVRVSRAAADQRRGRAGRTEPGICYRLWDEPQTGSLEAFTRPEIFAADLSPLLLDLAQWGATDPAALAFLDPPPAPALKEARALLTELDALDADGRITEAGKKLRRLPLPPRLARMVIDAGAHGQAEEAALIAAIVGERGLGGDDVDLAHRLDRLRGDKSGRARDVKAMAGRWVTAVIPGRGHMAASPESITTTQDYGFRARAENGAPRNDKKDGGERAASTGALLALAYPDRVAKNRGGGNGAFLLANGRGGTIDPASALSRAPFIVVADLTGAAAQGRILLAAEISADEIEAMFKDEIASRDEVFFDAASASLRARSGRRLGAIALTDRQMKVEAGAETAKIFAQGLIAMGLDRLPWGKPLAQFRNRVMFLRKHSSLSKSAKADVDAGEEWPDFSDEGLAARAADWLEPLLMDKTALSQIGGDDLSSAVTELLPWNMRKRLDAEAPTHFSAPSGSSVPIDYEAEEGPKLSIRVQELFGLAAHPSIAKGRVPLVIELLSPAHRPVQVTRDLPGFWRGSYADVKTEMKGRYPRHPWPEDPTTAPATRRAKPRGT